MRTDVTIWREAKLTYVVNKLYKVVNFTAVAWNIMKKLFGVGPNSYTIVGHPFYALVVLNSIFRNLESGILFSLIRFGNNPGLLHFPPNWRKSFPLSRDIA